MLNSDWLVSRATRLYSTTVQIQKSSETQSSPPSSNPTSVRDPNHKQKMRAMKIPKPKEWHIVAGVLLSRPPLLLPDLHPFEQQVQRYQEILERHQYSRFPVSFFFKKGSIGEKRWKQLHPTEPKVSGSGIIRDDQEEQEWILGGTSDEQIMKSRENMPPEEKKESSIEEEELSDDEKRDIEQFTAEEELEDSISDVPQEINADLHRLEREPRQTLYCLVKRSQEYHKKSGKPVRNWTLIGTEAPGIDPDNNVEGLHLVRILF